MTARPKAVNVSTTFNIAVSVVGNLQRAPGCLSRQRYPQSHRPSSSGSSAQRISAPSHSLLDLGWLVRQGLRSGLPSSTYLSCKLNARFPVLGPATSDWIKAKHGLSLR